MCPLKEKDIKDILTGLEISSYLAYIFLIYEPLASIYEPDMTILPECQICKKIGARYKIYEPNIKRYGPNMKSYYILIDNYHGLGAISSNLAHIFKI